MGNDTSYKDQLNKHFPIVSPVFQKLNYQNIELNEKKAEKICLFDKKFVLNYSLDFLSFIQSNQEKNIKLITFIGRTGVGKSTILNMIIKQFLEKQSLKMIFKSAYTSDQTTIGIDYYALQDKYGVVYVFFNCLGFNEISVDENEENDEETLSSEDKKRQQLQQEIEKEMLQEVKLSQLISLICGMSTCVFYVTKEEERTEKLFKILLKQINIEQQSSTLKNFIKIINQSNYEFMGQPPPALPATRNKFEQIFKEQFFLSKFRTIQESFLYLTEGYQKTISQITNYIQQSEFNNQQNWTALFKAQQTCHNFLNIFESAFEIINQGFEKSTKNFLEIINLQHDLKKKFREKIKENKQEQEKKCIQIFQILKDCSKKTHLSSSLCLILQDFVTQQGFRLISKHFKQTCDWWKQELQKKIREILQNGNLNSDQQHQLLNRYITLASIEPYQYRLKEKIMGQIKEQEQVSIATRTKFAIGIASAGTAGFIVGAGIVDEAVIITTSLLFGAISFPLKLIEVGLNNVFKVKEDNSYKSKLKRNLRNSLFKEILKTHGQIPIYQLQSILKEQLGIKFETELNKLGDNEKQCYVFHLYFNLLKSKLGKKKLQICQKKENLDLFEFTLDKYSKQYQNIKIDFGVDIFDQKIQFNQQPYIFENNNLIPISIKYQNRIDFIDSGTQKELISLLLALRKIESYFIFEIIRQTHFQSIVKNNSFQDMMIEENCLRKFIKFQESVING